MDNENEAGLRTGGMTSTTASTSTIGISSGTRGSPHRVVPIRGGNGTIPTRLHLTPTTSIPPSPTPPGAYVNINPTAHGHSGAMHSGSRGRARAGSGVGMGMGMGIGGVPFVPNLGVGSSAPSSPIPVPGSPLPGPGPGPGPAQSPYLRASKTAVDNIITHERERIKALELEEKDITSVEELKAALKKERSYSKSIAVELATLKSMAVANSLEAEVNEEGRINCLMRRLDGLQKEKGRIIVELEREEEMLTNTLQKKLNEVRREKAELEKQIEREHMAMAMAQVKLESSSSGSRQVQDAPSVASTVGTNATNTTN